ncbi:RHS repeat domain-containing protein [Lysobacter sp. cf310]|uniref:RHS repeat domain-containing protein n=1 Tax=Lysobacter sp. cf310 TaxID=1761790 RepID=UPI0008E95510|nr:Ig-like domain-containing protein [Lysobacter sp. cf310]SFK43357.1 RHS repeat-associated core domain-containing protein [Lysobacter sp. cf310]
MRKTNDAMGSARAMRAPLRVTWWLWLLLAALLPGLAAAAAGPTLSFSYPAAPEMNFAAPANVKVLLNATSGCGPINIFVTGPGLDTSVTNGQVLNNLPPGRYFIDASFEMCDRRWIDPVSAGRAFNVLGGSITASPQTCTIPWGGNACYTTVSWNSNAANAEVWYSLPDGSIMTRWATGQNGSAVGGIDSRGLRFYLKSGSLTLATVDVAAVPTNNSPPAVALTGPGNNYVYTAGSPIAFTANASDPDDGVQRVEFLVDGIKMGEDTSAPYELHWTGLEGGHSLVARAFDTRGYHTDSAAMWIVGNGPPAIVLTSPASGAQATVPASFALQANASDPDGVSRVEFYADNQLIHTDSAAPYEFSWSAVSIGPHTVHAIAYDNRGLSARSATASVTVSQPPSGPTGLARRYVYDQYQQLCKIIEPETGATVMAYDAAGNLAWSAAGLDLPDPNNCNQAEAEQSGRRALRSYDERNRLATLAFPDGRGDQTWAYTPDGLAREVTTRNDGDGQGTVVNTYAYNKRRMPTAETMARPGSYSWSASYGYDSYGNRNRVVIPDGQPISYANNALGQAVSVGSNWGTLADNVSYYPNGAIKRFVYGNGVVHTMAQNARQLPARVTDSGVFDQTYAYDGNGNTTAIRDVNAAAGLYSGNRDMVYDNRDRLVQAHLHWLTVRGFGYDALDNIRYKSNFNGATTVTDYYWYNEKNQVTNFRNDAGATTLGLGYDPQGNLNNKNGQEYDFDYGNRLRRVAGKEVYRYDAHGRRVSVTGRPDTTSTLSFYNVDGQLLYREEHHEGEAQNDSHPELNVPHVYLGGSLLALVEWSRATGVGQLKYQHTDALSSPIAVTDTAGAVIDRTHWEPYGGAINKPAYNGVGYAGHVMDGATGLTYMQQRYYDQNVGRFLSVDPVTVADEGPLHFNRYAYAYNNPYSFTDPDGRCPACAVGGVMARGALFGIGIEILIQRKVEHREWSELDKSDIAVAGTIGAVIPGTGSFLLRSWRTAPSLIRSARAYSKLSGQARNTANRAAKLAERETKNIGKMIEGTRDLAESAGHAATAFVLNNLGQRSVNDAQGKSSAESQKSSSSNEFQGVFRVEGRLDAQKLDKELKGE